MAVVCSVLQTKKAQVACGCPCTLSINRDTLLGDKTVSNRGLPILVLRPHLIYPQEVFIKTLSPTCKNSQIFICLK